MVDCSHGNSNKDHTKQAIAARDIASQIASGSRTVFGVMIESFLEDGNQPLVPGKELVYGKSVTDACLGWEATVPLFEELAQAVRTRRQTSAT
jgi:3-deoxy-7-phosphoheptulonate synthase